MLFLRSFVYFIGSVVSTILIGLSAMTLFFLPINMRYKLISQWAKFNLWWLAVTCNLNFKVIGKENIPNDPCVIISNHQSTWETLAFQTIFPHQTWVLKKSLLWIPIFGWGLALLNPITIDRGNKIQAIRKITKQGINRLRMGIWVIIYPEGTRQKTPAIGRYQKGGVAMAKAANSNLLPIYHNAGVFWPKGSFIKPAGTITIVIGEPIMADNNNSTELTKQIREWTIAQSKIIR